MLFKKLKKGLEKILEILGKRITLGHFEELLWRILPKSRQVVLEKKIKYVRLPNLLLGGHKGFVLYNTKTRRFFIFLAFSCKTRYTLYHEYIEGSFLQRNLTNKQTLNLLLKEPWIQKRNIPIKELKDWIENQQNEHIIAIVKEIELAKKELSKKRFKKFKKEVQKRF